jgi:hypothetical protein
VSHLLLTARHGVRKQHIQSFPPEYYLITVYYIRPIVFRRTDDLAISSVTMYKTFQNILIKIKNTWSVTSASNTGTRVIGPVGK